MSDPIREDVWRGLDGQVIGQVVRPGSPEYDGARRPAFPVDIDARPEAIVRCTDESDVVAALAFARRHGLAVAVRSGGHDFAGRSATPGLLVDVGAIDDVAVSPTHVTVGPGARLGDLYRRLHAAGRTVPAGSGATVGIAGLTLGGGFGYLGRRYGLTADHLVRARVVLADGRVVETDEHREPDLFWALRGAGGGRLGVVTQLVLATVPEPASTVFEWEWPVDDAASLMRAWQERAPDAPPELAASLLVRAPADVGVAPVVTVAGAAHGHDVAGTSALLREVLGDVAPPSSSWSAEGWWSEAQDALTAHAGADGSGDPPPHSVRIRSEFFDRGLPSGGIDDLVALLTRDRQPGEERELDLSPWGGAYGATSVDGTAFPHREDRFVLKHSATTARGTARSAWLDRSWASVRPWGTGRVYPNFPDPDLDDAALAYFGSNLSRVSRVRRTYDPDGVFAHLV